MTGEGRPDDFERYFTIEEALEVLADIRPGLQRIQDARAEFRELRARLEQSARGNGDSRPSQPKFAHLVAELERLVAEIDRTGVILRDPDTGLIDFPSIRGGEQLFLCYRLDEESIGYWHGINEGFQQRKPL